MQKENVKTSVSNYLFIPHQSCTDQPLGYQIPIGVIYMIYLTMSTKKPTKPRTVRPNLIALSLCKKKLKNSVGAKLDLDQTRESQM